jgi:hypothetical protein
MATRFPRARPANLDDLVHEAPAIVSSQSPSALAHA